MSEDEESQDSCNYPIRDISHSLYVPKVTLHCAITNKCIPCAYKINCFDVALDKEFTSLVPNTRPDTCPRSLSYVSTKKKEFTLPKNINKTNNLLCKQNMNVLTIGDGDFTFSLSIAKALSNTGKLHATSYESYDTLNRIYPNFYTTVQELESYRNVVISYNVDATDIQNTSKSLKRTKFHRIIFNFPCEAVDEGQDGQNEQFIQNQSLIASFLQNASVLLHEAGEIHVTHKTKPPYNQWNIQSLHGNDSTGNDDNSKGNNTTSAEIKFLGRIVFDKCCFLPYTPRKALDKKSFPCHDACIYIFGRRKEIDSQSQKSHQFPPSIPLKEDANKNNIIPVTKNVLSMVRSKHLGLYSQNYTPFSKRKPALKNTKKKRRRRRR